MPAVWILAVLPILVFYGILLRRSDNLPETDDYDAALAFLNGWINLQGIHAKVLYFIASQHAQYKLYFGHAVLLAEYGLTGRINFVFLQQLGNLFVLLTACALWLSFHPQRGDARVKLALFCPVLLLLFSPRFHGTVNWAMPGLQNLPVLFFAVLGLCLLQFEERWKFGLGCLCLVGGIASSANGFVLVAAGALMLMQQRRWVRVGIWTLVALGMMIPYAFRFTRVVVAPSPGGMHALGVIMLYPFAMLGGISSGLRLSLLVGAAMIVFAGWLILHDWRRRDPGTFFLFIFLLLTALGVTATRYPLGLFSAIASRYTMYSELLAITLYMAAVHLGLLERAGEVYRWRAVALVTLAALIYCVRMDVRFDGELVARQQPIRQHYEAWLATPATVSLVPDELPAMHDPGMVEFRGRAVKAFVRAEQLGYYAAPAPTTLR